MDKIMYGVKVYTSEEGFICLEQEDFGHDNSIILLHPDQIDLIFKWMQEARQTLKDS